MTDTLLSCTFFMNLSNFEKLRGGSAAFNAAFIAFAFW